MEPNEARIVSVDQLPDDPLAMPPPYWRSSGAVFCLLDAIEAISDLLAELVPVLERTEIDLDAHFSKYPGSEQTDEEMEEFSEIVDELWEIEGKIKAKALVVTNPAIVALHISVPPVADSPLYSTLDCFRVSEKHLL